MRRDESLPDDWSWASEILDRIPSGIDVTQLEERLMLTPTERLERMRQFLEFLEGARRSSGH
jgi:hypothetical protein